MNDFKKTSVKNNLWQSQNYLCSSGLVMDLLGRTSIGKDDIVIEIGPGKGMITWQLIRKCRKVYGIEYDFSLYKYLQQKFNGVENIEFVHGNFLEYELPENIPYKVFSNIPFNMTAEIVNKLVFCPYPPEDLYLFMQRESALKYAGNPYNRECMRSLLMKPFFDTRIIHNFKNTDFHPVPNISVVLLHIEKRRVPLIDSKQVHAYNDFIAYVFSKYGQSLKQRLAAVFTVEQFKRLAHGTGFCIDSRPTDLGYKQWLELFRYYIQHVSKEKQKNVLGAYSSLMKQQNKLDKIHRNRRICKVNVTDT